MLRGNSATFFKSPLLPSAFLVLPLFEAVLKFIIALLFRLLVALPRDGLFSK